MKEQPPTLSNNIFFLSLSIVHQKVNVPSLIKGKYPMEMFLWMALEMDKTCEVCSVHFCFYESKFQCFSITDGVLSDICINVVHIYDVSAVFVRLDLTAR